MLFQIVSTYGLNGGAPHMQPHPTSLPLHILEELWVLLQDHPSPSKETVVPLPAFVFHICDFSQ